MKVWVKRAAKEWLVLAELLIFSAFVVGDASGWIENLTNRKPPVELLYLGSFLLFGLTAMVRLVKLRAEIEEKEKKVRLLAQPGQLAIHSHYPAPGQVSIDAD